MQEEEEEEEEEMRRNANGQNILALIFEKGRSPI